jgi:hypothetical protein
MGADRHVSHGRSAMREPSDDQEGKADHDGGRRHRQSLPEEHLLATCLLAALLKSREVPPSPAVDVVLSVEARGEKGREPHDGDREQEAPDRKQAPAHMTLVP